MCKSLGLLGIGNHLWGLLRSVSAEKMFHHHLQELDFQHIYFNVLDNCNLGFILINTELQHTYPLYLTVSVARWQQNLLRD